MSSDAPDAVRRSALFFGRIHHARHRPRPHRFSYRLFQLYLDLDEVDDLFDGAWLWSHERFNVANFRRRDFYGDPERSLADCVRERVGAELGTPPPNGPIRLLTHVAFLGFGFNPVSFYYLFEPDGTTLHSIMAEITNTPWNERFQYVLPASTAEVSGEWLTWTFDKAFHVSPFFDMDHRYRWSFTVPSDAPGSRLAVAMESHAAAPATPSPKDGQGEDPSGDPSEDPANGDHRAPGGALPAPIGEPVLMFDAALDLVRHPFSRAGLRRCLWRHPWITGKVHAAIYWQALRLWMKRTKFYSHP